MHKRKENYPTQHWASFAQVWNELGPPLRPQAEDQRGYESFIDSWIENFERPRILILGVTPEIFHLSWPSSCELRALDRSREMIDKVWPGPPEHAIEGNWLQMPFPPASHQIAICDGGPILLRYPDEHRALVTQLHRLLVPGGRAVFRVFILPPERETVGAILQELTDHRVANLNLLKLRLGAALQIAPENGTPVQEILRAIESVEPDLDRLAHQLGWSSAHLRVLEAYRGSPARNCYVDETRFIRLFCDEGRFTLLGRWQGNYPLAERCPIVAFARASSPA